MEQNTDIGAPMTPVVENKQKNGNGLKIATAIACIVAVCGIGFGVYGMIQSSQKDSQISDLEIQINELQKNINNDISVEEYSLSVSEAQNFLNEALNLPLHSYAFLTNDGMINYATGLLKTESERANLIESIAESSGICSMTTGDICQSGAYITVETYAELYKKLFGSSFEYNSNETYGRGGHFTDTPCECECPAASIGNEKYYVWNNTHLWWPEINFIVEDVGNGLISGVFSASEDSENQVFKGAGTFELKYGHNESGYYIVSLSLVK